MSVSINFEIPPGSPTGLRQFPKNTLMRIHGSVIYGGLGVLGAITYVDIEPAHTGAFSPIYLSTSTNLFGHYEVDFTTPNADAQAKVTVTSFYWPASNGDSRSLPISFGTASPAPIPGPLDLKKALLWTSVAVGVGLLGYAAYSMSRGRKPQQLILVAPPKTT